MAEEIVYKNDFMHVSADRKNDLLLNIKVVFDSEIKDLDVVKESMNNIGEFFKNNFFSDSDSWNRNFFEPLFENGLSDKMKLDRSDEYSSFVGNVTDYFENYRKKQIEKNDKIELIIEYNEKRDTSLITERNEGLFVMKLLGIGGWSFRTSVVYPISLPKGESHKELVKKQLDAYYNCLNDNKTFFETHFNDIRLLVDSPVGLKAETKMLKNSDKNNRNLCCMFRCKDKSLLPTDDEALELWRKIIAYTFTEVLEDCKPFGKDNLLGMTKENSNKAENFIKGIKEYASKSGYPKFLAGGTNLLAYIVVGLKHKQISKDKLLLENISLYFRGCEGAPIMFDKPEYDTQLDKKYEEITSQKLEKILRDFKMDFFKKAKKYMDMSGDELLKLKL